MRWGVRFDPNSCVACQACVAACDVEHQRPPGESWLRVLPDVDQALAPAPGQVRCSHCADAPCAQICPTQAVQRRADGIVWIDHKACVGCRACAIACPYQVIRFNRGAAPDGPRLEASVPGSRTGRELNNRPGTSSKCTLCMHRIDDGLAQGLMPGRDSAATPACVNICGTGALRFGDLDDPGGGLAREIESTQARAFRPEFETRPGVYYTPRAGSRPADERSPRPHAPAGGSALRQSEWIDGKGLILWLAFFVGGAGSGLYLVSDLLGSRSGTLAGLLTILVVKGALHLAFLGKPLRAWRMLANLRTSWISRGLLCIGVFLAAGFAQFWLTSAGAHSPLSSVLRFVALASALVVATYSGLILFSVRAIPLWRSAAVPAIFLSGSLEAGAALATVLAVIEGDTLRLALASQALHWLLVANGLLVALLVASALAREGSARDAVRDLVAGRSALVWWVGTVGLGIALPLAIQASAASHAARWRLAAALGVLAGGLALRYCLLRSALYRPLFPSARREPPSEEAPDALVSQMDLLHAIAAVALPSDLSRRGRQEVVGGFVHWLRGYRADAELPVPSYTPVEDALSKVTARLSTEQLAKDLADIDARATARSGRRFAQLRRSQQERLLSEALSELGDERLDVARGPWGSIAGYSMVPNQSSHVAILLLQYYLQTPAAHDLCFEAEIDVYQCRPPGGVVDKPRVLSRQKRKRGLSR